MAPSLQQTFQSWWTPCNSGDKSRPHACSWRQHVSAVLLGVLFFACVASSTTAFPLIEGCLYRVRPNETLHNIAKSLNVMMDELQARNNVDLTNASNVVPGMQLNIPCPGSAYFQYAPLNIAGCFFYFYIDDEHPTLQSIVNNPPRNISGPFTITGIWIANYQALPNNGTDLTAPGQFVVGKMIYLPTCGHSGVIIDQIPVTSPDGCSLNLSLTSNRPRNYRQVADALSLSVAALTAIQTHKVEPDTEIDATDIIMIPCPQ